MAVQNKNIKSIKTLYIHNFEKTEYRIHIKHYLPDSADEVEVEVADVVVWVVVGMGVGMESGVGEGPESVTPIAWKKNEK